MDSSASANRPPIPSFNAPSSEDPSVASTPGSADVAPESHHNSQHQQENRDIGNDSQEYRSRRSLDFGLGNSDAHDEKDTDDVSISEALDYEDDHSVSTSSSGSSLGSEESLTLQERATRSQQRNALFLQALHEKYKDQLPATLQGSSKSKKKTKVELSSEEGGGDDGRLIGSLSLRGMLRPRNKRYLQHRKPIVTENSGEGQQWPLTTRTLSFGQRLQNLIGRYPQRKNQIRQLVAILHGTIHGASWTKSPVSTNGCSASLAPVHVPSPIFLSGPIGSGKTSIMKEVLQLLDSSTGENDNISGESSSTTKDSLSETIKSDFQTNCTRCSTAYINCSTIEPSSIERLVLHAYEQFRPSTGITEYLPDRHRSSKRRSSKSEGAPPQYEHTKRAKENISINAPSTTLNELEEKPDGKNERQEEMQQEIPHDTSREEELVQLAPNSETLNIKKDTTDNNSNSFSRVQPIRIAKSLGVLRDEKNAPSTITHSNSHNHNIGKASKLSQKKSEESVETFHSAIMAFGRILQPILGEGSRRAGILVLDHGERLLSFSARKRQYEKTNCLAELLLLPRVMNLNLTVVIISRYSILAGTRLNNLASIDKSSSTISRIRWVTITFPAYRGDQTLKQILETPSKLDMIVGYKHRMKSSTNKFMGKVVNAFLNTLVQLLSDSTRDINQYLRVGRSLWPMFVRPLSPDQINATMDTAGANIVQAQLMESPNEKLDKAILALLGKKLLNRIGKMSGDLTQLLLDSPYLQKQEGRADGLNPQANRNFGPRQPFLRTCLLLAAFICQYNRADQDKKVFSAHGNGKRKKRQGNNSQSGEEEIAYGSSSGTLEKVKSLRPRPFLVERVFSIFVTLVRLNPDRPTKILGKPQPDYAINELGSACLYRDLQQLVELGYLHPVSHSGAFRGEQTNLNGAKFWCSLSMEEATNVAKENGIPLENYIV